MEEIYASKPSSVYDFSRLPLLYLKGWGITSSIVNDCLTINHKTAIFYIFSLNLGLYIVAEIAYFISSAMKGQSDIFENTYLILCVGYLLIAVVKLFPLIWRMGDLIRLLDEMAKEHPKSRVDQMRFRVDEFLARSNRVIFWYALVMFFMVFCFCFSPLSMSVAQFITRGQWEVEFTYNILYPIDPYRRGFFEFFYISQNWAALSSSIGIICVDTIMCCVVQLTCMHFDQLSRSFLEYSPEVTHSAREKKLFLAYVEKHNKITE